MEGRWLLRGGSWGPWRPLEEKWLHLPMSSEACLAALLRRLWGECSSRETSREPLAPAEPAQGPGAWVLGALDITGASP